MMNGDFLFRQSGIEDTNKIIVLLSAVCLLHLSLDRSSLPFSEARYSHFTDEATET